MCSHFSIRTTRDILAAAIICIFLWTPNLKAQNENVDLGARAQSGGSTNTRRESIQKRMRYLGWKFAQQSRQDLSRWRRQGPPQKFGTAIWPSRTQTLKPLTSSSGTSLANVGFMSRLNLPAGFIPT